MSAGPPRHRGGRIALPTPDRWLSCPVCKHSRPELVRFERSRCSRCGAEMEVKEWTRAYR